MRLLSLDDVDVEGKKVFLRLDLNMPLKEEKVVDTSRLDASLKTLHSLRDKGAKTLIVTHIGRPKGIDPSLSTHILLPLLENLLATPVAFVSTLEEARIALENATNGGFVLLENIRFWEEEETGDDGFSTKLACLCDIYANDAFSVSHRKHASVYGVPKRMNIKVAGYNLLHEVKYLQRFFQEHSNSIEDLSKNFTLSLIGGSKVSTKITLIESLLQRSTLLIVGGGMANTFLVAAGALKRGASFYEEAFVETAKELLSRYPLKLVLPIDAIVTASLETPSLTMTLDIVNIPTKYKIVDIGPKTRQMIDDKCALAQTILWNGPFGIFEVPPFDAGSRHIAAALARCTKKGGITVAGGGDTLACLVGEKEAISFISTAGGAFLNYLEQGSLPGVDVLY